MNGPSITAYLKNKEKISKSSSLAVLLQQKWVGKVQKQGAFDPSTAKMMLTNYFEKTMWNCKERMAAAQDSCCYLTANKEHSLVQSCIVFGSMGYGLTHNDLHGFADAIVNKNKDIDEHLHAPIST